MSYRLAAMDLDGTTLDSNRRISDFNREAMEEALEKGAHIVVATGRAFSALPPDLFRVRGLRYVICSNGAQVRDLSENRVIYSNYIDPGAVESIAEVLGGMDYMYEVFTDGIAYTDSINYGRAVRGELTFRNQEYIVETRHPVDDIIGFMLEHRDSIENVNINFGDMSIKPELGRILSKIEKTTLTTSFDHNWELVGETTGKGDALLHLITILGVDPAECIAIGDSPNDNSMLRIVGMPIAVGNAKEAVKECARYITATNDEDGTGKAINKYILGNI